MWIPRGDWDDLKQRNNHEIGLIHGELELHSHKFDKLSQDLNMLSSDVGWLKKMVWAVFLPTLVVAGGKAADFIKSLF